MVKICTECDRPFTTELKHAKPYCHRCCKHKFFEWSRRVLLIHKELCFENLVDMEQHTRMMARHLTRELETYQDKLDAYDRMVE